MYDASSDFHCRLCQFAADRFANYWKTRLELFGKDKAFLRMSLSEAVKDDLNALRAGVYRLLPSDSSGRPLLYMDPSLNTGVDYTAESLVSRSEMLYLLYDSCEMLFSILILHFVASRYLVHGGISRKAVCQWQQHVCLSWLVSKYNRMGL